MFAVESNGEKNNMQILKEFEKLHLSELEVFNCVRQYVLPPEKLFKLGFPEKNNNRILILNEPFSHTGNNAQNYHENKKPLISPQYYTNNIFAMPVFERKCARCETDFFLTRTQYLTNERCYYHHGKLKYQWGEQSSIYLCCGQPSNTRGCSVSHSHVWTGLENGINDNLEGFVKTQPTINELVKPKIYALDCEMCYTIQGLELCKVTVVSIDGSIIYNSFAKPEWPVVDFNTRFSGVTEEEVRFLGKPLLQIQRDLLSFICDRTILVGHSLNNDLRALKIVHRCVVDTSLLFPHERGYPYRYSLKLLTWRCLRRQIQSSDYRHSSYEDAVSVMELLLWKILQDAKREE